MESKTFSTPELLAPAGGPDAFRAALAAGADAIYLGLDELNARRGAQNFTLETLRSACDLAHLRGRRVYLTANVLVLPAEVESALDLIDRAWAAGVDAVIVQDLGLMRMVRATLPEVRVHVSTQVNAHSSDTVAALASLGVSRVTLARETSIDEIENLTRAGHALGVETESFVHGALCVCYSGQCLLSSMVGGRSANRGQCAQPCRLPYQLIDEAGRELGDVGAHLLSPKDLAGITVLPALVASGVDSLKIEGRMKGPDYVSLVTGVYRAALDRALASPGTYEVRDGELAVLGEAFSRGFTEAYLIGERGNEIMSYRRPNNRGVAVGRVAQVDASVASIQVDTALDAEDTIEFWTSQGRFAQRVGPMHVGGRSVTSAPAGSRVSIVVEHPVAASDRVFRVRNAALAAAAERLYASPAGPEIPLEFTVRVVAGEPLSVTVRDREGRQGTASGAAVEPARTRAVTAEEVAEHVGRLGGTPYSIASWDIVLSPSVGIGFSALHRARRDALAAYEHSVLAPWRRRTQLDPSPPVLPHRTSRRGPVRIVAVVTSAAIGHACLSAGADEVHVLSAELDARTALPESFTPVVPRVCHAGDCERARALAQDAGRGVAGTLGSLVQLATQGCKVEAHWSLNALNAQSVTQLAELGAGRVWLSPELTLAQVRAIAGRASVPVGVAVGGRQELMVTEHCVLMSEGPCNRNCSACARRQGTRLLKDRKGYEFPVTSDSQGRTHVYNAVPLDVIGAIAELIDAGVEALRLDLETETSERVATDLVARTVSAVQRADAGLEAPIREGSASRTSTTSGHFFRGVS